MKSIYMVKSLVVVLTLALSVASSAFAQHKGIGFQATLKKPDGSYPTASGVSVTLQILDPVSDCVLREEVHNGVTITNGYLHLVLGGTSATIPGGKNPSPLLALSEILDNRTSRSGLSCVDNSDAVVLTGQTYTPAQSHARKLRLRTVIAGDSIVADFNMRAMPFAVNAESLDGKSSAAFVQTSTNITQPQVESLFARYTALDAILNGTFTGNAATATSLATAPGVCPAGQYMSAMTASGSITCGAPAGAVTSVSSANGYLSVATGTSTPVLTINVGTAANTVAAGDDSRFTDSRTPNGTAGGDLSGSYPNPTVAKIAGKSVVLTTPSNGEFLKYDGTNFVNAAISTADATKLPLAGGTMSGTIDMGSQNLTSVGFITMSANKSLHLSNNASDPSGLAAADKGKIWFNSTTGEIKYWDGSAAQPLGVAGSGLQTFNTQTGTSQTLAIGTSGTAPAWSSATDTHTLNIPMASTASVTAGLLSKTDYDAFNAKLGTATSFLGDVTGTSSTLSVDKIKGKIVSPTTYAAGQTLRYDGANWVNAVLGFADLGSKPTTLAGYGITDAQSSTLADGKIFVGDGSNVATAVTMSGDATLSNAGALTLATVPISKGGTGVTLFTGDRLITTSAAGALQATSCALDQVISFTAGGAITCANVSTLSASFQNGSNNLHVGAGDILSSSTTKPGGAALTRATISSATAGGSASLMVGIDDGSRLTRAEFFVNDNAVEGSGAWGLWSNYNSAGNQPFVVGVTNAERLRIDIQGNVGINNSTPAAKLDIKETGTVYSAIIVPRAGNFTGTTVNGMIRYNTSSNLFEFRQNGSWVNYTTVSDGRLKTNIQAVANGLQLANSLKPVFYDWDKNNPRTQSFSRTHEVGFIAQQVEEVLPEVVHQGSDSYRSIEYGKVVAVAIAAIQEISKQIASVDTEVETLKINSKRLQQENVELKSRLELLEKRILSESVDGEGH